MKPRVRTHYRAHKLSFWLHLVPDLQRNGYGAPSGHHNVNPNPFPPSSSVNNNIPSHPNSGLVILPPEDPNHNSSTPSPPTIQLVGPGPPIWEHNPNQQHGNPYYPGESFLEYIIFVPTTILLLYFLSLSLSLSLVCLCVFVCPTFFLFKRLSSLSSSYPQVHKYTSNNAHTHTHLFRMCVKRVFSLDNLDGESIKCL